MYARNCCSVVVVVAVVVRRVLRTRLDAVSSVVNLGVLVYTPTKSVEVQVRMAATALLALIFAERVWRVLFALRILWQRI